MLDMRRVMLELRKANFTGAVVPDHIQGSESRGGIITAYTIGYMRALRDAVNAL